MSEHEIAALAAKAGALSEDRVAWLEGRLPRWGDLYDLHGIVDGLAAAGRLLSDEGQAPASLADLTAVAAALLQRGRREVSRVRSAPLSPEVADVAEMDRIISAGLREGKPLDVILREVDERPRLFQSL